MQITCANCKTTYNLTADQVRGLSHSILPCNSCNKFIKITTCPHCNSYYSITFSSAQQTRYRLTCERCARPFDIDFPVIKEASKAADAHRNDKPVRERFSLFKRTPPPEQERTTKEPAPPARESFSMPGDRSGALSARAENFTLEKLFAICGSAFTVPKLAAASIAIILSFLLVLAGNRLLGLTLYSGEPAGNELIKSLLNIVPFAIIFFLYLMAAALISRMTMDALIAGPPPTRHSVMSFLGRAVMPALLANIIIFVVIDLVFILFGRIPVIGPVLFALLFLPIYITSLCAVILLAIGFWFYPPIIADSVTEGSSAARGLFSFIRGQNFSLAYTIPLMTIITGVTFAGIYLLHYGSLTLSMFLSKTVLGEEGLKVFSSIPATMLQFSDLAIIGSDSGLFKSLMGNLLIAHSAGGLIIGIIFTIISILLFSSFISITATLSTRIYLMIEGGTDMDDTSKIRLLALLVLILVGVFLVKKIFM